MGKCPVFEASKVDGRPYTPWSLLLRIYEVRLWAHPLAMQTRGMDCVGSCSRYQRKHSIATTISFTHWCYRCQERSWHREAPSKCASRARKCLTLGKLTSSSTNKGLKVCQEDTKTFHFLLEEVRNCSASERNTLPVIFGKVEIEGEFSDVEKVEYVPQSACC